MTEFLTISLGFPTLLYSIALLVVVGLWLLSAVGLLGLDVFDPGLDDGGAADGLGIFARLGLDGIPWLLVLTMLVLFGWAITWFTHLLVLAPLPGLLRYALGALVAVLALVPAILLTAAVLRPLRRLLLRLQPQVPESLLGKVAVVRTPLVDAAHGMADLDDGGAGLVLQVRSDATTPPRRGDRVVLVEHLTADNTWRVVPERDYASL